MEMLLSYSLIEVNNSLNACQRISHYTVVRVFPDNMQKNCEIHGLSTIKEDMVDPTFLHGEVVGIFKQFLYTLFGVA